MIRPARCITADSGSSACKPDPRAKLRGWLAALTLAALVALLPGRAQAQGDAAPAPSPATAAPRPKAVPAGRAAKNVAVITIHSEIDKWTAFGVQQRLKRAVADGADAIVFDINTPGGELGACLQICRDIKACPIPNTVAWINPDAYSAGAIIALSCREIVANDPSSFGDALPILADPLFGFQELPEAEREKMLGPLLVEVVDSARRRGYDEMLVQGLVRRGVELWLVEHQTTGQRLFVTAEQYRQAVGAEPSRGTPGIPSVTGAAGGGAAAPRIPDGSTGTAPVSDSPTAYQPAAPQTTPGLANEVNAGLEIGGTLSRRPDLRAPEHAGQYRELEYVSDGHGLILLKADGMVRYGLATQTVRSDAELKAYFGASSVARLDQTWSVGLVRFLRNPIVMGLLLIVFLLAAFIEMTHPGLMLPGAVAGLCLLALVVPPLLVDMSAWWAVAAIVVGIASIGVEVFLIPGFGVFGIVGILLLFGGMIGVFIGGPANLFPGSGRGGNDLAYALTTVLISTITSGILMFFTAKHLGGLPVVNRLVLKHRSGDTIGEDDGLLAAMAPSQGPVAVGATGRTLTPLRPAGRVQFGDAIVDVVSEMGFIDANATVRVVAVDQFRTVVERA